MEMLSEEAYNHSLLPVTSSPTDDPFFGNSLTSLIDDAAKAVHRDLAAQEPNWSPPAPEQLARLFPGYEIQALIGSGGMGAVYKAKQLRLNRAVAIKVLPAELAVDPDFVQRFEREAQTLAGLNHPGIVAIYDSGQTSEGHLFFVMELVDGSNLQQHIKGLGLSPMQALEITIQVCEALHYAHSQGVVHRDIKPANVLVTQGGKAKLVDFGLSRPLGMAADGTLTSPSRVVGSPHYMAPEQWEGKSDCRTDIYALGITLYEMLTRTRPALNYEPPSVKADVDTRLDEVVSKALRQQPEQRYQVVSEMQTDVDHIRTTPNLRRRVVPGKAAIASRPVAFDSLLWGLAICLLSVLAYGVYVVVQPRLVAVSSGVETGAPAPAPAAAFDELTKAKADLSALVALMDFERVRFRDALAVINKNTNFKKTPVREGSSAYFQCLAASKVIHQIEASAPQRMAEKASLEKTIKALGDLPLLKKIAELEASLQSLKEQLSKNTDLPVGSTPSSANP